MKKRLVCIAALCITAVSFIACGGGETTTADQQAVAVEQESTETPAVEEVTEPSTVDVSAGEPIFAQNCAACHQASGEGIPGAFPPLKGSDFLKGDKATIIKVALNGSKDADGNPLPITVNGTTYPGGAMAINHISDEDGKEVVNYILNSWGNNLGTVTVGEVAEAR